MNNVQYEQTLHTHQYTAKQRRMFFKTPSASVLSLQKKTFSLTKTAITGRCASRFQDKQAWCASNGLHIPIFHWLLSYKSKPSHSFFRAKPNKQRQTRTHNKLQVELCDYCKASDFLCPQWPRLCLIHAPCLCNPNPKVLSLRDQAGKQCCIRTS